MEYYPARTVTYSACSHHVEDNALMSKENESTLSAYQWKCTWIKEESLSDAKYLGVEHSSPKEKIGTRGLWLGRDPACGGVKASFLLCSSLCTAYVWLLLAELSAGILHEIEAGTMKGCETKVVDPGIWLLQHRSTSGKGESTLSSVS